MTNAEIVNRSLSSMPIADLPLYRLEELSNCYHGASIAAIAYGYDDDSYWFSYLSETYHYCYLRRKGSSFRAWI